MITIVLLLSALAVIALPLVIFCFMFFSTCVCLLCVMLQWLVLGICFNFLAAMMRNESWIASSSSLMACSVSMARLVQMVAEGFC